jgi:LruC domain-containing protein
MDARIKNLPRFLVVLMIVLISQSCLQEKFEAIEAESETGIESNADDEQSIYAGFDFKTVDEYDIEISVLNNLNLPLDGVYMELYTENPLDEAGLLKSEAVSSKVFKGITNSDGILQCKINPPTSVDSLHVLTYYIGLNPLYSLALINEQVSIQIGGKTSTKSATTNNLKSVSVPVPSQVNGYYTLGTWNGNGVPDYMESTDDVISAGFLDDVNASLPERFRLPDTHPEYLSNSDDSNLKLIENCEVWVTFVHEGAGWHNSLGYYTYPTNNPPSSVNDINDLTIIFPDLSIFSGGLSPGNKVQLYYLNPETNEYSATFPSGISVGWFLIAQGWSSGNQSVGNGVYKHYSNVNLNVESNPDLQKHNVLLYDDLRQLLLLGFEDIRRDNSGCDQDFNDAVFYTTVSPFSAIEKSTYQEIDTPTDSDGDGVNNTLDDFPFDATNSFNNYYPSENGFGTLVYEDMWPSKGDYDFNDLVVDYNYNQVTNAQNKVVAIRAKIKVKAIGASYHNAFGIALNTTPGNIDYVAGQLNTKGFLSLASNGTENGQSKAVIIFFDDAFNVLPYPGTGVCVNTFPQYPYVTPTVQEVDIVFITPIDFNTLGTPPYNPFIIVNRIRGKEVHLPNLPPTDLVNQALFGTGDDDSNINTGDYYVSDTYLPWAINLPSSFSYPSEKKGIVNSHLKFDSWANSRGYNYMDWYEDKTGYRDDNKIYSR